jgi:hypothetical protein
MAEQVEQGAWVEIYCTVLTVDERAPHLPEDTKQVPLEMRVKGFLATDAVVGEEADIVTPAGRRLRGVLSAVNPPYSHGFGSPIAELLNIGSEVRSLLRQRGRMR